MCAWVTWFFNYVRGRVLCGVLEHCTGGVTDTEGKEGAKVLNPILHYSLAQTWFARTEFYIVGERMIANVSARSRQVEPGRAVTPTLRLSLPRDS
jgi:hypothetical protein